MSRDSAPTISLVIPCYNEEAVLRETASRLANKLSALIGSGRIGEGSAVFFVDDGSRDETWKLIEQLAQEEELFHGIKLSANRGHQNALLAGLLTVEGDVVISMDADLQDDIDAIDSMLEKHQAGFDIVYGVRSSRDTDSAFKRTSAELYYRMLRAMGVDLVFNHADFRLMSRVALDALKGYREVNLFLRGIIPTLGFKCATVEYARAERFAGETKYPLRKMLSFAWNGITSFSNVPLRLITALGLTTSFLSVFLLIWVFAIRLFTDDAVPGWASITIPLIFLGGVQLLSLGVIGEYVSKIYSETKARPRFIIEKRV